LIVKLLLTLVALIVIAGSFYADYRWKRWISRQRDQRERGGDEFKR
jgi:hypothetical protein